VLEVFFVFVAEQEFALDQAGIDNAKTSAATKAAAAKTKKPR
jgi:hypothetical protein